MSKSNTKKQGRPKVINKECVQKLEQAFRAGMNVMDACLYAQIARQSYYTKLRQDKDFLDKMAASQLFLKVVAKKLVAKAIVEGSISRKV
jgi:hypothetical protein